MTYVFVGTPKPWVITCVHCVPSSVRHISPPETRFSKPTYIVSLIDSTLPIHRLSLLPKPSVITVVQENGSEKRITCVPLAELNVDTNSLPSRTNGNTLVFCLSPKPATPSCCHATSAYWREAASAWDTASDTNVARNAAIAYFAGLCTFKFLQVGYSQSAP